MRRALWAVLGGDLETAESELAASLQERSDDVEAFFALARLYRNRGEVGRAIRIHQNLLLRADLGPQPRIRALLEVAADFAEGGFLRRAIASYQEVLVLDRRNRQALAALVGLLPDAREFADAIALKRKLDRLEGRRDGPGQAALYLAMARDAHGEGRADAGLKAVKRARRLDPNNPDGLVLLGELEAERGKTKAAIAAWAAVPALAAERGREVYPRLEASYSALGKSGEYEAWLRSFLEEHPADAHARLSLARRLVARREVDEAIAQIRRVFDAHPGSLDAHVALGRLLLSERRDPEAIKEFAEVLEVLERRALAEGAP